MWNNTQNFFACLVKVEMVPVFQNIHQDLWLVAFSFLHGYNESDFQNGTKAPGQDPHPDRGPDIRRGTPSLGEIERWREEARKLEEVGQSLESSSTRQVAQMAAEVGPLMSAGEEPARKKLQWTVGGKAPRKEIVETGMVKRSQKYWPGIVALHKIHQFQKTT